VESKKADSTQQIALIEITAQYKDTLTDLFLRNNRSDTTRFFRPFALDTESATRIANYRGLDMYFLGVIDQTACGFTMLRGMDEGFEIPSFGIFVDHEHRAKGLGQLLTLKTINAARKAGFNRLRLTVHESNCGAVRLYESIGFRETLREPIDSDEGIDTKITMILDFDYLK